LAWETIINNVWFLIFLFMFLVPQIQKSLIETSRRGVLQQIARKRSSTIITLIHRQETVSFFGIPLSRYIDIEDSEEVLRAIRMAPDDSPIDLIIHTPGGIALAATQIALALKAHEGDTTAIIPHFAMSGGTLIALAADKICMDPHAVLGPVDPQLGDQTGSYPAASLLKLVKEKNINEIEDKTFILAEQSRKAMKQTEELVRELIEDKFDKTTTDRIVDEFVSGKYTHDYPITKNKAQMILGACIEEEFPKEVYTLMNLYRMEVGRKRPSVESIPLLPSRSAD
jgi:ClpP class serine protease